MVNKMPISFKNPIEHLFLLGILLQSLSKLNTASKCKNTLTVKE